MIHTGWTLLTDITVQFLVAQLGWGRVIGEAIPWQTWCQLTVSSPNRICTAWKCAWKCDIIKTHFSRVFPNFWRAVYIYLFIQQFFLVLESDWLIRVSILESNRTATAVSPFYHSACWSCHFSQRVSLQMPKSSINLKTILFLMSQNVVFKGSFKARMYLVGLQICGLFNKDKRLFENLHWHFRRRKIQEVHRS